MINLRSFLGLCCDVLNTVISLASVLSALIWEAFDHRSCAHPHFSGRLQHGHILTGLAAHSLNRNNASRLLMPGPSPVKGSPLFAAFAAQSEQSEQSERGRVY